MDTFTYMDFIIVEVSFYLTVFVIVSVVVGVAFYFHLITHELGHLVFGLLTGYRFLSFRIHSLTWIKMEGKVRLKRYALAGTAGECLMLPPDIVDGKIPFVLFNLGGSLINLISAVLFLGAALLLQESFELQLIMQLFSLWGFYLALTNGIPLPLKMFPNDGTYLVSMLRSRQAVYAYWLQLKINAEKVKGIRMKDMPAEWFELPGEDEMKNDVMAAMAVEYCQRLMDQLKFQEADKLMKELLQMKTKISGIHRGQMINNRIYCELINQNRPQYLEKFFDKRQKKFNKMMRSSPSVIRVKYTCALLATRNYEASQKIKNRFNSRIASYPYPAEIDSEWELICYADYIYKTRTEIL